MTIELPEDLPFRTPPDIASRHQVRFAFDRLGKRLDRAWDALGLLNEDTQELASGGGLSLNANNELQINAGNGVFIIDNEVSIGALDPITVDGGVVQLLYGNGLGVTSGSLYVKIGGSNLYYSSGAIYATDQSPDYYSDSSTVTSLANKWILMTDGGNNLSKVVASNVWYLGYGNPAGLSQNNYVYNNLTFSSYTINLGYSVKRSDWNNEHQPQINAIFLQIIDFIEDVQATVNANAAALASKGL